MNLFERKISAHLHTWKSNPGKKPLILRGARQVGKTTAIRQFGSTYNHFISLNLEKDRDARLFDDFTEVNLLVDALCLRYNIPQGALKDTLLFIDEIQESVKAIKQLRYFYEEVPDLHVIAAGSLLEHVIKDVKQFPVGRIQYLYLFPLNFQEFLLAMGQQALLDRLQEIPVNQSVDTIAKEWYHKYLIIGGMPEVVHKYLESGSIADLATTYESIWSSYRDDVEKYASNNTEKRVISHIMSTAASVLDQRITYQNFGNSTYRSREVSEALEMLDAAQVIQLIHPSTSIKIPVITDYKKRPRIQFLDTGILNYTLDIQANLLALDTFDQAYRGALIPHMVTQELISLNSIRKIKPHFWVREKKQSTAEVDIIREFQGMVIPMEIKFGKTGSLKSLHQFVDRSNHPYAVRIYGGSFSIVETKTPGGTPYYLMNLPYYLTTYIDQYLEYFINSKDRE